MTVSCKLMMKTTLVRSTAHFVRYYCSTGHRGAEKLDCKALADFIVKCTREKLAAIGASPKVAVFLPTNSEGKANLASATYVARKMKFFAEAGIQSFVERISSADGFSAAKLQMQVAADSPNIQGLMLQLPLPKGFYNDRKNETRDLLDIIPAEKDIDVLSTEAIGRMFHQPENVKPATPHGICALFDYYGIQTRGQHVTVIGKGALTGSPLTKIIMDEPYSATISICDEFSKPEHLKAFTNNADIVISAAGVAGLIKPEHVHSGTVLIDVAMNTVIVDGKKKLTGDVDPEAHKHAGLYTTVPGGVGLLTTVSLCFNVLNCYRMQRKMPLLLSLRTLLAGQASHVYSQHICRSTSSMEAVQKKLKILLFSSGYNGMTQSIERMLQLEGHQTFFQQATSSEVMTSAAANFAPDLIICPTLMKAIPEEIDGKTKRLIVHPGIKGDRGPSSIDWAIIKSFNEWGITIVEAHADMDAGDIWATQNIHIRANDTKSSIYNGKMIPAGTKLVAECIKKFQDKDFFPEPLNYDDPNVKGRLHATIKQSHAVRIIEWNTDTACEVVTKVRAADGQPGVKARIKVGGGEHIVVATYFLHGASQIEQARVDDVEPGTIFCKSGDAVGIACINGEAVWISQLRKPRTKENPHSFKLPATIMLRCELISFKASMCSLTMTSAGSIIAEVHAMTFFSSCLDQVQEDTDGFKQIHWEDRGTYGILHFDFYNGAMGTHHCEMLANAIDNAGRDETSRLIILAGNPKNWSNGLNLNLIEHAPDPAVEAWNNIRAINKVVKAIIARTDDVVVSAVQTNAGAGGVYMALAGDLVFLKPGVVLNPHYKNMGLYGSELHTYCAVKRAGITKLMRMKNEARSMFSCEFEELQFADNLMQKLSDVNVVGLDMSAEGFLQDVCTFAEKFTTDYYGLNAFLKRKHANLAEDHLLRLIDRCEDHELSQMHQDIFENRNGFSEKRKKFVLKV